MLIKDADKKLENVSFHSSPNIEDSHLIHPKYRSDIDGLRALAVLIVIGFHAAPGVIKGGFIGVDIFFVISGYLISSIIFSNLEKNNFSFYDFYSRRIKRIFPALILVLIATILFGWSRLVLTSDFNKFGAYVISSAGFFLNFILWYKINYFNPASSNIPLLHLWSLSIEEQFYIFWPLLLWIVWKRKYNFLTITVLIAIISFVMNVFLIKNNYRDAAFYCSGARFWELMIGGILAYFTLHKAKYIPKSSNFLSVIGMACILIGLLFINNVSSFPGWWACLPVIGAFLFIAAGSTAWINKKLFAHSIMVFIGIISYPLYLWHWLLLYIVNNQLILTSPTQLRIYRAIAVVLSFVFAWCTFAFVEKPIRFGKSSKRIAVLLVVVMFVIGNIGCIMYCSHHILYRSIPAKIAVNEPQLFWLETTDEKCIQAVGLKEELQTEQAVFCRLSSNLDKVKIAIFGDSTANSLYPGFVNVYKKKNIGVINLGNGTCAPFHKLKGVFTYNKQCELINEKIYNFLLKNKQIKTVILGFTAWDIVNMQINDLSQDASLDAKFLAISEIVNGDIKGLVNDGRKVIVTFDSPNLGDFRYSRCIRQLGECVVAETDLLGRQPYLLMWSNILRSRHDITIFSQSQFLERDGKFNIFDNFGILLFRDNHHLSFYGSDYIAKKFIETQGFHFKQLK